MFENVTMVQSTEEGGAEGSLGQWILELVTATSGARLGIRINV